jgi:hypothetical protein
MNMPRLRIDADELVFAMGSHDQYDHWWLLDLETGETILYSDGSLTEMSDELAEAIEEEGPDRFLRIEPLPSRVAFTVMEDFVETVTDARAHRELLRALDGRRPFRGFKDALFDWPDVREEWFRFEFEAKLVLAAKWLEDHKVDAELVRPARLREGQPEEDV